MIKGELIVKKLQEVIGKKLLLSHMVRVISLEDIDPQR